MNGRLATLVGKLAVKLAADPIVVLCLSLMVTLPCASYFSHDFASAYMFTGMAVCASALFTLLAMVASDRSGKGDR